MSPKTQNHNTRTSKVKKQKLNKDDNYHAVYYRIIEGVNFQQSFLCANRYIFHTLAPSINQIIPISTLPPCPKCNPVYAYESGS